MDHEHDSRSWSKFARAVRASPILTPTLRASEMDVTMIGLENAGKTSLLRVLSVRICNSPVFLVFLVSWGHR